ncbi:hypothetical protein psyc5s11_19090 [Clostridium gelidum]|uniref:Cyclic di-GMP phosphodiesterase Gmr n=1 Tax=Clostridium gelidum TaxID=704125 RepID=A0ABM7T3G4_9CLOT|nr:EAL domain-containing protein [Clostridium gelidum]BCZ45842.1 hypothetical protein psyc5s11_19090 [Clostridium gelidum]
MRITFRVKLFLFCIFVILFTSIPIAISTYNYMYNLLKADLISDGNKQMVDMDNDVSDIINKMKNDVKLLANNDVIEKTNNSISGSFNIPNTGINKKYSNEIMGLESSIYNYLELYGKTHSETEYVCLGTKWGGYISWPDGLSNSAYDPRQRPWYSLAMEHPGEVVISDPHKVEIDQSNNVAISACTTIKNTSGDIVGALAIDTSLNKLSEIVRNTKIGDKGYIFIFLKDGTMLAHANSELNFKNMIELADSDIKTTNDKKFSFQDVNKLLNTDNDSFETVVDGNEAFVNVYTSPQTGWKMATVTPKSDLTSKVSKVEKIIFGITICILILGIALTYVIVRIMTNPIRKLTPLMELAGNGDFSVRADIKTKDEFGKLGSSFNLMIKQLSSNYEELSAVYEELVATEEELRAQYDELQYNEEALRNSEDRYKLALECANDSIWEWNLSTGNFYASDRMMDITGYKLNLVNNITDFLQQLIHPEDLPKLSEDLKRHINNEISALNIEYRLKTIDGSYVWVLCKGKTVRDSDGKALTISGSISNITERKMSEEKIKFMAYYDLLTKLPNVVLFKEKLNEQLKLRNNINVQGAVFLIDLDNFKNINDLMGHDYGDELLIYLTGELEKIVDEKSILFRFGGDEFIILKTSIKEEEICGYSNKLLSLFNKSFKLDNKQISVTASIGVILYPKHGVDSGTIIKNVDSAMYEAKKLGKNRFELYSPEIYAKLERKTTIERILRSAIDNNEFTINYQPQYYAEKNEIFGFEALLRLNSRELGFISPVEFIPIAEESGYITQISLWVFKESCKQSVKLLNKGCKFKSMSINISSVDLRQPNFLENLKEIIDVTGIEPQIIELEITETVLMQSFNSSINALNELIDMGIRIALDDFGTGYSSLNYLMKMPISTLKIDKSFIDDIVSSSKEQSIINNIIQMAHTMDLKVVAEGVETKEQFLIIKDKKCDYIQGYYFSKPLPASEIEGLFI